MVQSDGSPRPGPGADIEYLRRLTSTDWRERQEAIQAITQAGQAELVTEVLKLIQADHAHLNVLSPALQVLEQAGQPVIRELIELLNGPDIDLRVYIPIVLNSLGGPEAIQALIQAAGDESQPDNVRFNAVEALGQLQSSGAVETLRQILKSGSPFLKFAAVFALGQIGALARPALDELKPLLEDIYLSEPAIVAFARVCDEQSPAGAGVIADWLAKPLANAAPALTALAEIARRSPDRAAVEKEFLHKLDSASQQKIAALLQTRETRALSDQDTALACGWFVKPRSSDHNQVEPLQKLAGLTLVNLLAEDGSRPMAEQALSGQQGIVLDELIAAVNSPNSGQARAAIRLLGETAQGADPLRAAHILPVLRDALENEDETLVELAVYALGKSGAHVDIQDTAGTLWPLLDHPSGLVRKATVQVLDKLAPEDLAERTAAWRNDPLPHRRSIALTLLAVHSPGETLNAVLTALEDPDPEVRQTAFEILPRLKDPGIPAQLKTCLTSPDPATRRFAVQAATQLQPEAARPLLLQAAEDSNSWIRLFAVRSLVQQLHPDILPILLRLAEDPLPPVRQAATEGLTRASELPLDNSQLEAVRQKLDQIRTAVNEKF